MKYSNEVTINKPLEKVIELFDNPANMSKWQPGFISMEHLSGTPGEPGAKSKLKYKMGKREIDMIETIITRDLPKEFHAIYEAKGVYSVQKNYFSAITENETKWVAVSEFKFNGFMKVFGWLMPGTFKKQSQQFLDLFKAFAEKGG